MTMHRPFLWLVLGTAAAATVARADDPAAAQAAIRKSGEKLIEAFNAGKAEDVAALFLPVGEFIDDDGNIYSGREEISALFAGFFERFPGSKLTLDVESIRVIGTHLAIEEGSRYITTQDGKDRATVRYVTVWMNADGKWSVASVREAADDPPPTPKDQLEPLAWMVGEWINEGSDSVVSITYKWSEDGNYLLGDYDVKIEGRAQRTSTQRIGWDPVEQRIRSWLFDTDGGFAEGLWTQRGAGWVVQSSASLPDGQRGSATLSIEPDGADRFVIKATNRVIGGVVDEDFEVTVVRKPPAPAK